MQCSPQTRHWEIEGALLAFELTERRAALDRQGVLFKCELRERRVALLGQLVLLVISVAFAVVTIICALHGSPWPVAAGTGGASSLTAAVGFRVLSEGHGGGGDPE
jgi:hypothetical protein